MEMLSGAFETRCLRSSHSTLDYSASRAVGGACRKRPFDLKEERLRLPIRDVGFSSAGPVPGYVQVSVRCSREVTFSQERTSVGKNVNTDVNRERLWRDMFSDPSQWWDNRSGKPGPSFPDFKHKRTRVGLWVQDGRNPPWVASELASMASFPETERVATATETAQSDLLSWNRKIGRLVKDKEYKKAMDLFEQLKQEGMNPTTYTFVPVLKACTGLGALEEGKRVHAHIIQCGLETDIHLSCTLIDMYAKCGNIKEAREVFDNMTERDVVSWTAMIVGCVKCGEGRQALELSQRMQDEGVERNFVTFLGIVNACASLGALEEGRRVHEQIIQQGFESDLYVSSSLVDMYGKCGSIEDAGIVFNKMAVRNVVTWNTMIQGSVKCGDGPKALELYRQMQVEEVKPDQVTFVGVLNACASTGDLEAGREIHEQIIKAGFESALFIRCSLVDMYAKCGSLSDASKVFNSAKGPVRDTGSWNAMILGYVRSGQGQKALDLYRRMQGERVKPDYITFVGALNACASVAALWQGRTVHSQIIQSGCELNEFIESSLIDMYSKCGSIQDAERVFDNMSNQSLTSWNAMLGGYAMYGHGKAALEHFERMRLEGPEMDSVTFVCLLSAFSHAGLVDEGLRYFQSMSSVYNLAPQVEHYSCVVDLLGRAGRLLEAANMIETMPCEATLTVWMSLLSACRVHRNVELGERAAKEALKLDPGHASAYVLLSNIYAAAGRWDGKQEVHRLRLERGVKKEQGMTWVEIKDAVHSFTVDDQDHPQINEIREELERLYQKVTEAGYVPDLSFALHDVDDEEKARHLWRHSEKLAIAFRLINPSPDATPIRIYKNLRVCGDCHTAIKFIAKIVGREIIVKDCNRFHCFKDGFCSCRDCW